MAVNTEPAQYQLAIQGQRRASGNWLSPAGLMFTREMLDDVATGASSTLVADTVARELGIPARYTEEGQAMPVAVRQPMRLVLRVGQARVEYELDSYSVQTVPNVERADPRDPVAVVNVLEVEVNVRPGIEPSVRCTLSGQAHHLALADLVRETTRRHWHWPIW